MPTMSKKSEFEQLLKRGKTGLIRQPLQAMTEQSTTSHVGHILLTLWESIFDQQLHAISKSMA
jgi:hypothetical protein